MRPLKISTLRARLRKLGLHLRAQRQQPFIIECLTWDNKLTGLQVREFGTLEDVEVFTNFIDANQR